MSVEKTLFGKTQDGTEIYRYCLRNEAGMEAQIINYGAILVRLYVPNQDGKREDVVLGYDNLESYYVNEPAFGATIGPNANRIAGAAFVLEGITYTLDANNGENNLHSHASLGYHKRVWDAVEVENGVTFTLEGADGEMGFPGNKKVTVTYSLSADNELRIHYHAESDKNTIINMTNHSYFNLAGHAAGTIGNHLLTLNSHRYTPLRTGSIPTGEVASVEGTPMDFTVPKRIGQDIDSDFAQLTLAGGYDHNWVLEGKENSPSHIATVEEPISGRKLEVYTDLPGVQFYTGNFIQDEKGKDGAVYTRRAGFCLETQYYPNTANEPAFPSAVFGPQRPYDTTTIYKFT